MFFQYVFIIGFLEDICKILILIIFQVLYLGKFVQRIQLQKKKRDTHSSDNER